MMMVMMMMIMIMMMILTMIMMAADNDDNDFDSDDNGCYHQLYSKVIVGLSFLGWMGNTPTLTFRNVIIVNFKSNSDSNIYLTI